MGTSDLVRIGLMRLEEFAASPVESPWPRESGRPYMCYLISVENKRLKRTA
jgi:hypothetical protein